VLTTIGRDLAIQTNAALASLHAPSLTYIAGSMIFQTNGLLAALNLTSLRVVNSYIQIRTNNLLARIDLPDLSVVNSDLGVYSNPALTFVSLPKLTFIGGIIQFCENHADFRIPSGPPDAPLGGLVVSGSKKNQMQCYRKSGSALCGAPTICP
jgi:hypothetical protein